MQRIKVAVLRGGPGVESEVSMKSGKNILENLSEKYIPLDVFIDKDRSWYLDGVAIAPVKLFRNVDVVFNALHGEYGEDGKIQQLMDQFGVKYTGSTALASALAMNKVLSKEIFIKANIKTPVYKVIKRGDNLTGIDNTIFKTFPMPCIVKPAGSGSSIGVSLVKILKDITPAIEKALKYSETIIVEEFIRGKEITCGVIENFRGEQLYSLLPLEIATPKEFEFYGYEAKYSHCDTTVCVAKITKKEKEEVQEIAANAHRVLGLRHYSRADFIVNSKRGVYILEVNTLPGMTKDSLMPKSLETVGCSLSFFLDHVIQLALNKKF